MDKSKAAVEMFNKMAKLYEARYMNVESYAESFKLFCEQLDKADATILELGCGPGNVTKYLLDRNPQYKILATDLAPNMIEVAKINCPTATFQIMDCRQSSVLHKKFDAVMAGFCLPYLAKDEVLDLFQSVNDLLSAEGIFYLSTMDGNHSKSGIQKSSSGEEVFIHYYDDGFLKGALVGNGFEIIKTWIQPDLTQKQETTDLIILAKKVKS